MSAEASTRLDDAQPIFLFLELELFGGNGICVCVVFDWGFILVSNVMRGGGFWVLSL